MEREEILQSALAGDINAFQKLFAEFQSPTEILPVSLTYLQSMKYVDLSFFKKSRSF
jgi:hypothetical protein